MERIIKYIAWIITAVVVICIIVKLSNCRGTSSTTTIEAADDTSFVPIVKRDLRPRSTPFERSVKLPTRLPKGITEANVARIVTVIKQIPACNAGQYIIDTTNIIILKSGKVAVPKQDGINTNVEVVEMLPPILDFGLFISIGITLDCTKTSPAVAICLLQICGAIQFPLLAADLYGIGAGGTYRWKIFSAGMFLHYSFTIDQSLKLIFTYNF